MIRVYQIRSPSAVETPTEPDTVEANGASRGRRRGRPDDRDVPLPSAMAKERDRNWRGMPSGRQRNGILSARLARAVLGDVHAAFRDSEGRVPTELELEEPEVARGKVGGEAQRWFVTFELDRPGGKTGSHGRIVSGHQVSGQDDAIRESESAGDDQRGGSDATADNQEDSRGQPRSGRPRPGGRGTDSALRLVEGD